MVKISVNNGEAITNEIIRGTIIGKKLDEDGFTICGALFGLFRENETEFTEETALATASPMRSASSPSRTYPSADGSSVRSRQLPHSY